MQLEVPLVLDSRQSQKIKGRGDNEQLDIYLGETGQYTGVCEGERRKDDQQSNGRKEGSGLEIHTSTL